jgi:hypothetical protein
VACDVMMRRQLPAHTAWPQAEPLRCGPEVVRAQVTGLRQHQRAIAVGQVALLRSQRHQQKPQRVPRPWVLLLHTT